MAVCFKCHARMAQTEAICPRCGYDFPQPEESWWDLLSRRTSLRDLFFFLAVMAVPAAFLHYAVPVASPAHFAFGLGVCSYFRAGLLERSAPMWSRIFDLVALAGLILWPFLLFG